MYTKVFRTKEQSLGLSSLLPACLSLFLRLLPPGRQNSAPDVLKAGGFPRHSTLFLRPWLLITLGSNASSALITSTISNSPFLSQGGC